MTIKTYPKMNDNIVEILRYTDNPPMLYAAQRIEELEAEVERLQIWHKLWNEVIDMNCWNDNGYCCFCGVYSSKSHKEDCLFDRADAMMARQLIHEYAIHEEKTADADA